MRLAVLACSKEKIWDEQPDGGEVSASRVYISRFHLLSQEYAHLFADTYVILSAKYGFLRSTDIVEGPYDITFSRPTDPVVSPETLCEQAATWRCNELLLLLPPAYEERVRAAVRGQSPAIESPLAHLTTYDDRNAWLEAAISASKAGT